MIIIGLSDSSYSLQHQHEIKNLYLHTVHIRFTQNSTYLSSVYYQKSYSTTQSDLFSLYENKTFSEKHFKKIHSAFIIHFLMSVFQ